MTRRQYLQRLREAAERYPISVLNYMPTSNHVHLLVRCERADHLSSAMQYVSGCIAQDYNRRKRREGAFWAGRFRPTLIQHGHHLSRCFFYISLNMVRAGAVGHPSEWVGGSHAELIGEHTLADSIIDREALLSCLECGSPGSLRDWYLATLDQECRRGSVARQPYWTETAAVGDEDWIRDVADVFPAAWRQLQYVPPDDGADQSGHEDRGTYIVRVSERRREALLASMAGGWQHDNRKDH